MEKSVDYRWVVALFFTVVGVAFVASILYLATGGVAPDTYWGRKMTLPRTETQASGGRTPRTYLIELNKSQPIGDRIFFYRGRQGDRILLDVIIPEIDSQYAYPFTISLGDARKGVEVAGLRLRLNAVRPNFVSFKVGE